PTRPRERRQPARPPDVLPPPARPLDGVVRADGRGEELGHDAGVLVRVVRPQDRLAAPPGGHGHGVLVLPPRRAALVVPPDQRDAVGAGVPLALDRHAARAGELVADLAPPLLP